MEYIKKLASAIYNDIVSGLRGYHSNPSMSLEQLEDEIVEERLALIKEYSLKGVLPTKDLLVSINCIKVDCKDLDRCNCGNENTGNPVAHFEIPQLINDYGDQAIEYIGSTDRQMPFIYYTSSQSYLWGSQYRKRGRNKPYVYIDITPKGDGLLDGYIFNAPMIKEISIVAIFKDPRQLEDYGCCEGEQSDNYNFLTTQIKEQLTKRKIYYYRQLAASIQPNNQEYSV